MKSVDHAQPLTNIWTSLPFLDLSYLFTHDYSITFKYKFGCATEPDLESLAQVAIPYIELFLLRG